MAAISDQALREPADRLRALERLLEVTGVLAGETDLMTVLESITHEACRALGCERASLYRFDSKRQELYTSVVTELEISEIRRGLSEGISGYVATHRELVNVPDPAADSRWNSVVDRATGYHTRSILAAPLESPRDGALLGVLQALNNEDGPFDEFDEQIMRAFSRHAALALDRARMIVEIERRHAVEAALNVAREVQRGFLPTKLPSIPGYELAAWWRPNQAVGGDYCDIVPLPDGAWGLVIADVSGHGLGPSLLMASVRAALRALVIDHSEPEVLLSLLNRALAPDLHDGRFITMIVAALDHVGHRLRFANAGHGPAEHFSQPRGDFTNLAATGVPLGVLDDADYTVSPWLPISPGDIVLFCTDGIVEITDHAGEPFGLDRLRACMRNWAGEAAKPLAELANGLGEEVVAYFAGDQPPDDLTILAVRRES